MYMHRSRIRCLLNLVFGITCLLSIEARAELQPFPYTSVEKNEIQEVPDYRLVLSNVAKVNGRINVSNSRRLNANLVRSLYRLNDGFELSEVWGFYQQQLQRNNAEVWFQCHGRDCGVSSLWANEIFEDPKLSGLEQSQHYGVYHWRSSGRSHIAIIYGIVRANKRIYIQVDQVTAAVDQVAAGPITKKSDLPERNQTPLFVPVSLNASDRLVMTTSARTIIADISQKLLTMRPQRVYLVGHYISNEGIETEMGKSQKLAKQLSEYIMSTVTGLNLDPRGVGPLSSTHPEAKGVTQWVEIFVEN